MCADTDDESAKDRRIDELEKEVSMLRRANFTFAGLETSKEALEKYSMFQPYEIGEWGNIAEKAIAHAQGLEELLTGRVEQNAKLNNQLAEARAKIAELEQEILSRTAATEGMFDQLYALLEDANAYTVVPSDTTILCTCEDEECPVLIKVGEHGELFFENDLGHSTMVLPDNYFIGEKLIVDGRDD